MSRRLSAAAGHWPPSARRRGDFTAVWYCPPCPTPGGPAAGNDPLAHRFGNNPPRSSFFPCGMSMQPASSPPVLMVFPVTHGSGIVYSGYAMTPVLLSAAISLGTLIGIHSYCPGILSRLLFRRCSGHRCHVFSSTARLSPCGKNREQEAGRPARARRSRLTGQYNRLSIL